MWLFDLLFSSVPQIWYVEVRMSRSVSQSTLGFEITGVDCTKLLYYSFYVCLNHSLIHHFCGHAFQLLVQKLTNKSKVIFWIAAINSNFNEDSQNITKLFLKTIFNFVEPHFVMFLNDVTSDEC